MAKPYEGTVGYLALRAADQQRKQAIAGAVTNQVGQETDIGGDALGVVQGEVANVRAKEQLGLKLRNDLDRAALTTQMKLDAKANAPRDELKDELTRARIDSTRNLVEHRGNLDNIASQRLGLDQDKFADRQGEDDIKHRLDDLKLQIQDYNARTQRLRFPYMGPLGGVGVTPTSDGRLVLRDGSSYNPQGPLQGAARLVTPPQPEAPTAPAGQAAPVATPAAHAQPSPTPAPGKLPRVKEQPVETLDVIKKAQADLESGQTVERMTLDSINKLDEAVKKDPKGFGFGAADLADAKLPILGLQVKIPGANWLEDALVSRGYQKGTPAYNAALERSQARARLKSADEELAQFKAQAVSGLTVTDQQDQRIREVLGMMNGDSFRNDPVVRRRVMQDFLERVRQLNRRKKYILDHHAIPLEDVPEEKTSSPVSLPPAQLRMRGAGGL